MIEKWCGKSWAGSACLLRWLADQSKRVKPATWIISAVLALTAIQCIARFHRKHVEHRDEIISAIGSAFFFYGVPQPERSDSEIRYFRTSSEGVGLYVSEVAGAKRVIICQKSTGEYLDYVSPFSPDGALFAYAINTIYESGTLSICQSGSGRELARLKAPNWHVYQIAWLTAERFVCKRWVPDGWAFSLIQRRANGAWTSTTLPLTVTKASYLNGVSDDLFTWDDDRGLRAMRISSEQVLSLWKPKMGQIVETTFSRPLNEFLVTCKERKNYSLWRLKDGLDEVDNVKQVASDDDIQNAQWLGGGEAYAYLKHHKLVIKAETDCQPDELADAKISYLIGSTSGNSLFFIGTVRNEPWDGLWSYDLASRILTNVASYSDKPSLYATSVTPLHWTVWSRGKSLDYQIYYPAHFNRHRKYPILIGDTSFLVPNSLYVGNPHGPNWAEAIADCGAFVAIVYRPSWWQGLNRWDSDVMALREDLIRNPIIEKDNVFLFGTSAETTYMSRLVEQRPELWKGVIFLNPDDLPDLPIIKPERKMPRMLISAGADEGETERFKEFQEEAFARGIPVEIQELPKTGHYVISTTATLSRTRAMVDFIFGNGAL